MKKLILPFVLLILCFTSDVFAQEFSGTDLTMELSDPIISKRNYHGYFIVGDDNVVFSRNTIKKKPYIIRYNKELEEDTRVLLEPDIVPKRSYIESVSSFNGGLVIFYSTLEKATRTNTLYYAVLSQDDLSTLEEPTKVFGMTYTTKRNSGNFSISMSKDSSKLLVFANTPTKRSKTAKDQFNVVIINQDFSVMWDDKLTVPYADRDFSLMDFDVDNQGNVYIMGQLRQNKKSGRSSRSREPGYKILRFTEDGDQERFDLKLTDKNISDIGYRIKENGDLICAGLYSNKGWGRAAGAFYLEIDGESLDVLVENMEEFDVDFFTQGMSDRQKARAKKKAAKGKAPVFRRYVMRHLIEVEEGGMVMVAEQYYVTESTTTDANGRTTTTYYYHYNDIIVVGFDADGEIEWNEKIQKTQVSTNDYGYYSSFNLVVKDDALHFFFLETGNMVPGLGYTKSSNREAFKGNHLVHAKIDIEGEKEMESMGMVERKEHRPVVKEFQATRDGRAVVYLRSRKTYKIGWIQIE